MTIIGIDYGEGKIGLAVADYDSQVATPLTVFNQKDFPSQQELIEHIAKDVQKWKAAKLVLGLPLDQYGQETEVCKNIRSFAEKLKNYLDTKDHPVELDYYPEYYSTQFSTQGLSRKQKQTLGDAYAASYILAKYLEWQLEKQSLAA